MISMKTAFKINDVLKLSVTFSLKIALDQRHKAPWLFMILGQNSTYSKMDIIGMLHSC